MSVNDGDSGFTAEDVYRLERSVTWQQQPVLIETLCRLLHDIDPMDVWSGENSHAKTEYLSEATALAGRMSAIHSEQDFGSILAAVFHESFDGYSPSRNWNDVAKIVWPRVSGLKDEKDAPGSPLQTTHSLDGCG